MSLRAHVGVSLGELDLDVELAVEPGEVVAVLGPNGAGKTTLLRALAGLVPLDAGRVEVDGYVVEEPSAGVAVSPEKRAMGVVFQDYLLFANLSALENVAFGLRARGMGKAAARAIARSWLDRVELGAMSAMKPSALSGGQAQRVALARALAVDPRVLLLDEPLAALDAGTRAEVRRDLRHHLEGFAGMALLVTHDPIDAHALADRVVVVERGRVVQEGTLTDVTAHPRSRYVAELVGTNLVHGAFDGHVLTTPAGGTVVVGGETAAAPGWQGAAFATIRPQAIALHQIPPEGSPRNAWGCTVAGIDRQGDRVRVVLEGSVPLVAEITAAALAAMDLHPGDEVWAAVKAAEVVAYPE